MSKVIIFAVLFFTSAQAGAERLKEFVPYFPPSEFESDIGHKSPLPYWAQTSVFLFCPAAGYLYGDSDADRLTYAAYGALPGFLLAAFTDKDEISASKYTRFYEFWGHGAAFSAQRQSIQTGGLNSNYFEAFVETRSWRFNTDAFSGYERARIRGAGVSVRTRTEGGFQDYKLGAISPPLGGYVNYKYTPSNGGFGGGFGYRYGNSKSLRLSSMEISSEFRRGDLDGMIYASAKILREETMLKYTQDSHTFIRDDSARAEIMPLWRGFFAVGGATAGQQKGTWRKNGELPFDFFYSQYSARWGYKWDEFEISGGYLWQGGREFISASCAWFYLGRDVIIDFGAQVLFLQKGAFPGGFDNSFDQDKIIPSVWLGIKM
ncbi:MAG: hypothetical protein NTW04_04975 [Elusimicrobia bacterium]|nr:hypothetical protein [Elusimicrobiota bacterium]